MYRTLRKGNRVHTGDVTVAVKQLHVVKAVEVIECRICVPLDIPAIQKIFLDGKVADLV